MQMNSKIRLVLVSTLIALIAFQQSARADKLNNLLKKAARITDDVALRSSDDVLARIRTIPRLMPSKEALAAASKQGIGEATDIRSAAVLLDGAQRIEKAVPDLLLRSNLIARHGHDAILSAGLRSSAADDLIYLHSYLQKLDLPLSGRFRTATMADYARVVEDDVRWGFWTKYVKPHKQLWAGGAALTAYLVNPEYWHDSLGNIVEGSVHLAADLAGEQLAAVLRGAKTGANALTEPVVQEIKSFFTGSPTVILTAIAILSLLAALLIAPLRQRLLKTFRYLFVAEPKSAHGKDTF